jgi:D-alanyl-D-alanine carboxypeptidase (penicillin-binding protein 5/6)
VRTRGSTHKAWGALLLAAALAAMLFVAVVFSAPSGAFASVPLTSTLDAPFVVTVADTGDAPTAPHVTSKGAIVIDAETGTVLYSWNADKQLAMASTTKMMTAILILESMSLDENVKVPAAAVSAAGSTLGFSRGETFTVEQLLYAMLVPSANDAAITLGVAQAGSIPAFVEEMNARAVKMGLTNTHFVNDCGLQADNHYSSARDLAKIAAFAMQNEEFRKIVSTKEYTLPHVGGVANRVIKSSNELLLDYSWVNGIKTGSTPYAGYCLVSSATKDGLTLISVVLGAKDQNTRESESKTLLEYGFAKCQKETVMSRDVVVAEAPVADSLGRTVPLVTGSTFSRRLLGDDEVTAQVKLSGAIALPVASGDAVGELDFFQGDASLGSVKLLAAESVDVATVRMIMDHWGQPWAKGLPLTQFVASRN